MLRARKIAPALRLGHALEIAKRLERANGKAKVAAEPPDVAGAAVERQQVVLENLDLVEAGAGDGAQLFIERTAQRDRGDREFGHAICSGCNRTGLFDGLADDRLVGGFVPTIKAAMELGQGTFLARSKGLSGVRRAAIKAPRNAPADRCVARRRRLRQWQALRAGSARHPRPVAMMARRPG